MTTMAQPLIGASTICQLAWSDIDWKTAKKHTRRLQMRIAKAIRENRWGKVKALQRLLTHSFYAKTLAVKRVIRNKGGKTPGVDGVIWSTPRQKMKAVLALKNKGYKTKPLKRIYIPKKNGRKRPLSIPSMFCRAMQALHLYSLEPIAETLADKNSYGFRPKRSTADAVEQCFKSLAKKKSAQYILECDIKACFDSISHSWLIENIPINKTVLRKWLKAGFIDRNSFHHFERGTPQGGVASPVMMNMTLDGLEAVIKSAAKLKYKVHFIRFADDWIVTGPSQELLQSKVLPAIVQFLEQRGLEISKAKTRISHINDGFDFLGFNMRKYNGKLLIKPSKGNIKVFLADIRKTLRSNYSAKTENLIRVLNPKIRGWGNYYRHSIASRSYSYVDHFINKSIWNWAKRRHHNKSSHWVYRKYFRTCGLNHWTFFSKVRNKEGEHQFLDLFLASNISIKKHIKIKAQATPFDPAFTDYFEKRSG